MSAVVSIKRHPANSRQVALPHLHANSTGLPGFVRILRLSPRLPPSLPTTSVDQNVKVYTRLPTAHVCRFAHTEQSSDRFITWAARIFSRQRSLILSINRLPITEVYKRLQPEDAQRLAQFNAEMTERFDSVKEQFIADLKELEKL